MTVIRFGLLLAMASCAASAKAGTIESAIVIADPQMQVKDGAIQGCGYRLKSVPQETARSQAIVALDTSVNFYENGLMLAKGGAVRIDLGAPEGRRTTNLPIQSFWLKAAGASPTVPLQGKVLPAETKGYLLYAIDPAAFIVLHAAIVNGETLTIGARIKGEPVDRIYSGLVTFEANGKTQIQACFDDLNRQLGETGEDVTKEKPAQRSGPKP